MGSSLQDQLLKAGLTDQKKVNKAKKAKQQKEKAQRHSKQKQVDESTRRAREIAAEAAQRDRELNRQKQQSAEAKAIAAQVRQLIEMNRLSLDEGEQAYNFSDGNKVQRIHVTEAIHRQLSRGRLAIVKLDGRYEVVPAGAAEKIGDRSAESVIVCNEPETEDDSDDPYADFKIPDDLMW
ncbi:DUF2058 domain-containing protein [Solemya velesiana gill symbiont]|uniref:Nucleoprotein/polynucleotide-associated enzyme n=1 Tax=Solemya velesiana gill symbiont TaxID=1918948 RepID=A0A1T2KYB7_9GAMM|nr:DUF2058 domain-containing protein [Solemya velesiana gill symbiont]OOZ37857.1 nucleoprotein/polynucleotide-associated enzyme [Solemya velesiana gill symbiont]